MCNFNNRQLTILFAVPNIHLFRERLSENVHATILKGIVGGFEFTVLQRNLKELARKAMKMCLRVLTERNKVASIISHITFRDCRMHIFSDNLSRNSCKRRRALVMHQPDQPAPQALRFLHGRSERETPVTGDDGTGTDGRRIHGQTGRSTNGTQNFRPGIAFTISVQISSIFQKTTAKA